MKKPCICKTFRVEQLPFSDKNVRKTGVIHLSCVDKKDETS